MNNDTRNWPLTLEKAVFHVNGYRYATKTKQILWSFEAQLMTSLMPGLFILCMISMESYGCGTDCKIKRTVVQSIFLLILED